MAARPTISERLINTAARRVRKATRQLPLLRRMAAGDMVIPEVAVNRVLRKAGLDDGLPLRWETLAARFYDGYFEIDVQGALGPLHGPTFRLQARFESVEISLNKQIIRIRLLREIQSFSRGTVERLLLIFLHAIFGRLFQPDTLLSLADRSSDAFTQEAPDLLRIDLHHLDAVKRQIDGQLFGALGALLGEDTVLIHAIDCHRGELIVRTTTVAQELARKGLKIGVVASSAASRVFNKLERAGRSVAEDWRQHLFGPQEDDPQTSLDDADTSPPALEPGGEDDPRADPVDHDPLPQHTHDDDAPQGETADDEPREPAEDEPTHST